MPRGRKKKENSFNYSFTIKLSKSQKDLLDSHDWLKKEVIDDTRKYLDNFINENDM